MKTQVEYDAYAEEIAMAEERKALEEELDEKGWGMFQTLISKYTVQNLNSMYRPKYDPDEIFRPAICKEESFPDYKVDRRGVIVSKRCPTGLVWGGTTSPQNPKARTIPRVSLRKNGVSHNILVSVLVAHTFVSEMSFKKIPLEILEDWDKYSPLLQSVLLNQTFQVDHINRNVWQPSLDNLQFMLPADNHAKDMIGNTYSGMKGTSRYTVNDG